MPKGNRPEEDMDDLISRIYDVALDPARYADMVDTWDNAVWPENMDDNGSFGSLPPKSVLQHFQRADAVLARMEDLEPVSEIETLLEQFRSVAAVIFAPDLTVATLNSGAAHLLKVSAGDRMTSLPIDADDRVSLTRQVSLMMADPDAAASIFRVRSSDTDNLIIFQMRRAVLSDGKPLIVAVSSDIRWPAGFDGILRDAFGLSGAEIAVTRHLLDCASVKEVAEARGRSIDTIRAQIKTILAKTEMRGQVELVRLVLSMMDIASVTQEEALPPKAVNTGAGMLKSQPYHTAFGRDDRRLDYLILGDPNGTPVMYLSAEYAFCRWPSWMEEDAARRGMKVISPIRGGYGMSDPVPKNVDFGQQVAIDLVAVLEAEDVAQLPIIVFSDDVHFAAALENERPGTVSAIIAASGGMPFLNRAQVERLHKWQRFIQAGARYSPNVLPFLVRMATKLIRRVGMHSFLRSVFSGSEADLKTLEKPGVIEAIMAGTKVAVSEDFTADAAFTQQTIFEQKTDLVARLHALRGRVPVHFLSGLQDPAMPAETLKEHQEEFDWIEFEFFEDIGQLLLFDTPDVVLDLTEKYIQRP